MTLPAPAHLLLAVADARMRGLLCGYLRGRGFLVSRARDAAHARRLLEGLAFDLLVVDGGLPGRAELCTAAPCLVLGKGDAGGAEEAGSAWLPTPFEPSALAERIDACLDRPPEETPPPKLIRMGPRAFDAETGALTRAGLPVRLTATELQLLRIFASRPGETIGRGEVIARLGREGLPAKARAIDVQVTRLRRKLEDDPKAPKYLQTMRGAGYRLVPD